MASILVNRTLPIFSTQALVPHEERNGQSSTINEFLLGYLPAKFMGLNKPVISVILRTRLVGHKSVAA
jgi:hypothetical protein